jgi:transaldolase
MLTNRPRTKILVDGGDPEETLRIKSLIGFVDGQTTNPSLIAKNPEIQQRLASGHQLSEQEEKDAYKKIVQSISPLVGNAGVSIEVFADLGSRAEEMLAQGQEMFTWIPNAYVKYPCTHEGLRAAEMSVQKSIRVNMTLCFSQEQAAAVYAATRGIEGASACITVGRPTRRSRPRRHGPCPKYQEDVRTQRRPCACPGRKHTHHQPFALLLLLGAELATVPSKVLEEWAAAGFPMPDQNFKYKPVDAKGKALKPIPYKYKELDLDQPRESFDLAHELTTKGIKKFVADYQSTLKRSA